MSYINEALKKAQKNKDARHIGYMRSIGKAGDAEGFFGKKLIFLTLLVIFIFASLLYYRFEYVSGEDPGIAPETAEEGAGLNRPPDNRNVHEISRAQNAAGTGSSEEKNLKNKEGLYKQAVAFFKEGKLKEAEKIYKEILSQDPGHINALNDMGVLSLKQAKYKDAVSYLEKAIKLKPDDANPYYNLACTYSLQKEPEKGMDYLLKAIAIDEQVRDWADNDPDLRNIKNYAEYMVRTR